MKITQYVLSIICIIIFSTIAGIFFENKGVGKYINYFFSSLIILMIITPIASLSSKNFEIDDTIFDMETNLDTKFLGYLNSIKNAEINSAIQSMLAKNGYKNVKIHVDSNGTSNLINTVLVNLDDLVIAAEIEHINKYNKITSLISNYLDIEKEAIIYE